MILVCIIDVIVVAVLIYLVSTSGVERALPFFAFVVVFVPRESQIVLPGLFALTTWRVALSTLAILYLLFKNAGHQAEPLLGNTPFRYLILIHLIWSLISTVNSISPVDSLKQAVAQLAEYYLMYYIMIKTVRSVETIHRILAGMLVAVAFACVIGVFEAYSSWRITEWFPPAEHLFNFGPSGEGRGNRIMSTFSNYSLFGAAIAFAVIDVFYFLQLTKGRFRKIFLWLMMVLMFWVIYKTVTRGPWLALIIGSCLLILFCRSRTRAHMLVIAALCVAVLVIRPGVWLTVKNIYLNTLGTVDPGNEMAASYEYRYALWHVGADALAREPSRQLWGYGLGSFYALHLVAPFNGNPEYPFESCDNAWVQQMVEAGYVGLALMAALLVAPSLVTLRNVWKMPKPDNYLCGVLFVNMVQYYFMMTNVAIYGWGQTGYMLWMWIGMSMVYGPLMRREAAVQRNNRLQLVNLQQDLIGTIWL